MLKISESISLPSQGFFSPFLHSTLRYRCKHVFSLGAWSPLIQTGFLVSGPTWDHTLTHYPFPLQGFNLLRLIFSMIHVSIMMLFIVCPATPTITSYCGLGSSHFDRLYYGNLIRFLFLQVLRYFTSLSACHFGVLLYRTGYPIRIFMVITVTGTLP